MTVLGALLFLLGMPLMCDGCKARIPLVDRHGQPAAQVLLGAHKSSLIWGGAHSIVWLEGASTGPDGESFVAYLPAGVVFTFDRASCAAGRTWTVRSFAGDALTFHCQLISTVHPEVAGDFGADALAVFGVDAHGRRSEHSAIFTAQGTFLGIWLTHSKLTRGEATLWRVESGGMPLERIVDVINGACSE